MINHVIKKEDKIYVQPTSGFTPPNTIGVVPKNIAREDWPYLQASQVTDPETGDTTWEITVDEVAKGEALLKNQTEQTKKELRASYIADIDAEMTRIFGTTDRDKANALYNTWYEFLKDPAYFADQGLTDDSGLPLDTASKVAAYAQVKVNECKNYAVFLIRREKEYILAKSELPE